MLRRFSWLINFILFLIFQLLFYWYDGSGIWIILGLNDWGEKMYQFMENIFYPIIPYETVQLNFFTYYWLLVLLLHGLVSLIMLVRKNQDKERN